MSTTPTGIPIVDCPVCEYTHAETREHCLTCGTASLFLNRERLCLRCRKEPSA